MRLQAAHVSMPTDCKLAASPHQTLPLRVRTRLGYQLRIVLRPAFSVQEQADDRRRCPESGHVEWRHADGILNVEVGLLLQKPFDSWSLSSGSPKETLHLAQPFHCAECHLSSLVNPNNTLGKQLKE